MRVKAAVLKSVREPYTIEELELEQINDVVDAMARRQIKGRWVCELEWR